METLGGLIRNLRTARGLSLRQMARQAGITHPTVGGWEKDAHLPRLPELEAVLKALNVTTRERHKALRLLAAPRAIMHVRQEARQTMPDFVEATKGPPSDGELLRAMRERAGRTREETAQATGISVATLRRWEHSETWPSPDKLHALCYYLEAHEAEVTALTCRGSALMVSEGQNSGEQILGSASALRYGGWQPPPELEELFSLRWEAQAWRLPAQCADVQQIMFALYYWHMERLVSHEQYAQARRYVARVLALADLMPERFVLQAGEHTAAFWMQEARSRALIMEGTIVSRLAPGAQRRTALRLAASLNDTPNAGHRAWMQSVAASLIAQAGDSSTALEWGQQACIEALKGECELERLFRYRDLANILAQSGRTNHALDALETSSFLNVYHEDCSVRYHLQKSELLLSQHRYSQAQDNLQQANSIITTHNLAYLRSRAETLSSRF